MHGSKKNFKGGRVQRLFVIARGVWGIVLVILLRDFKEIEFCPPPPPSVHVYCQYPVPKGAYYHKYAFNMDIFST